jgi:hypothetical protein
MSSPGHHTAAEVTAALLAVRSDDQLPKVRTRLAPDEPAFGMRMRDLFAIGKANTDLPLEEVDRLLDPPGVRTADGGNVHPRLQGTPTARGTGTRAVV